MTTVLVVDDEPDLRAVLRDMLEERHYTVLEAGDGLAALAMLRASPVRLVVLLDYSLPRLNGDGVLQAVEREGLFPRHRFALVTAGRETLPLEAANRLSLLRLSIIRKPFELDDILSVVAKLTAKLEED